MSSINSHFGFSKLLLKFPRIQSTVVSVKFLRVLRYNRGLIVINYLKIDKSFISNTNDSMKQWPLVEAIIVVAHEFNLQVIAEGVKNDIHGYT